MSASQVANLSEKISSQKQGIVLVFSRYSSGNPEDSEWSCHFVPKELIRIKDGGIRFIMSNGPSTGVTKYLYFLDNQIQGHANNEASPNNGMVLRYVFGV